MGDLKVTIERLAATITVHAAGPVDHRTAGSLLEPLLAAAVAGNPTVCVDLALVTCMSNSGLRVLVLAAQALRVRDARLRLAHVPPHIENVLRSAGFTTFVDVT